MLNEYNDEEFKGVTVIGCKGQMLTMSDGNKRYKVDGKIIKEKQDLTGIKFGSLTVLELSLSDKQGALQWLCRCDCGKDRIVRTRSLKSGSVKKCRR